MKPSVIRSMATAEIIRESLFLYKNHLAALVVIAALPHAALLLLDMMLVALGLPPAGLMLMVMVATVLMNAVALTAITLAVAAAITGEPLGVREVYARVRRSRLTSIVIAYTITVMLTSTGFMLLVLPGLLLGGMLALTIPSIVLERLPPLSAINRSLKLIKGEVPKGMAIFTFIVLISAVIPLLFHLLVGFGPLSPLLNAVLGSALLPLAYTANVVLYLSVRAAEGYSAEQLTADLHTI